MNKKYQMEIDNFIQRFGSYRDTRIILYGIGRYTATLLEGLKGFRIVGLMDKDPENTGKKLSGVPVVDQETAEKIADMVIINTAETYWNVIYDRIRDIKLPVYYINGKKAGCTENRKAENPFKGLSYLDLSALVENAEVISFDFFDTLFMRSVCSPQDIFRLMEVKFALPITQMRDRAKKQIRENYSLDELYRQMEISEAMPYGQIEVIKNTELALEEKMLVPRRKILSLLKELLESGREVYIISDMYLPKDFYTDIFRKYDISVPSQAMLLSNELNANKTDGTLWEYYAGNIVKGRPALHIGDNRKADFENPGVYDIQAYLTPSVWEMLLKSSLRNMAPHICGLYDTSVMGCVMDRIFEDPFALNNTDGMLCIKNNHDMGYCVFGPVIMTFALWLLRKVKEDGIKKLVFMARDGYFLKEDFESICTLLGENVECCYIGISRQLAMMASIETEEDLAEYAAMPYTGSNSELLEDRFGIKNSIYEDIENIEECINAHLTQIKAHIAAVRRNYQNYLEGFGLDDGCAVVDIGYYGNNQRYLNKLLDINMAGYYFNANLSGKNENAQKQRMKACFQNDRDSMGKDSRVLKKQIYLESLLTAPHGMIREIDKAGNFLCAPDGKNQEHFKEKEEINEGIIQFMTDYIERFGGLGITPDTEFADKYYGNCFDGAMEYSDEVKQSFYNDNAMMNRIESSLFY